MRLRKASTLLVWAAVFLLAESCVQYCPADSTPEPPQPPPFPPQGGAAPAAPANPQAARQDEALVAPIALYPDPLVALILPASTVPADLAAAASYLIQFGDASRIDSQPWDPSVRGLAHYPAVIAWMVENMAWTQALGAAFIASPSDIMDAIQRLRARALEAGTLKSTPQQQVYSDGGVIEIYPAQPDSVFIPVYDDSVVYSDEGYAGYGGPFINFGDPFPAGVWLSYYFDWGRHRVWAGDHNVWREHNGWQPPLAKGDRPPPGAHPWQPPAPGPGSFSPSRAAHGNASTVPRPMPGAPDPPPEHYRRPAAQPGQSAPLQQPLPRSAAPFPGQFGPSGGGPAPVSAKAQQSGESKPNAIFPESAPRIPPGYPNYERVEPAPAPPAGAAPPPAPVREYSEAPARSSEPPAPHSAPAREPAPAQQAATEPASRDPQK